MQVRRSSPARAFNGKTEAREGVFSRVLSADTI